MYHVTKLFILSALARGTSQICLLPLNVNLALVFSVYVSVCVISDFYFPKQVLLMFSFLSLTSLSNSYYTN